MTTYFHKKTCSDFNWFNSKSIEKRHYFKFHLWVDFFFFQIVWWERVRHIILSCNVGENFFLTFFNFFFQARKILKLRSGQKIFSRILLKNVGNKYSVEPCWKGMVKQVFSCFFLFDVRVSRKKNHMIPPYFFYI